MNENEMEKYLQFLTENDELFRGKYLYQTARIDEYLNGIVAYSYFPTDIEKRKSLVGFIINQINFNRKTDIFIRILKKHYPKIAGKYSKLNEEFDNVRKLRNKLAHSQLDTSIDYLQTKPDRIRWEYYQNGEKEYLTLTISELKNEIGKVYNLFVKLTEIMQSVSGSSEWALSEGLGLNDTTNQTGES